MGSSPFYYQQPFCQLADGCRVLEFDPPKDLAPFVAKLGYVTIKSPYIRQRVPDGCYAIHVGIHGATGATRCFVRRGSFDWGHVLLDPGWTYVEARLRWGAGMNFFGCSPEDMGQTGRSVEELLGKKWRGFAEKVSEAESPRERMHALIEGLRQMCPQSGTPRPEVVRTMRMLEKGTPWLRVDDLADAACLSASQLRRLFAKELGASPKDLLRLSRLWWSM